jgi:hypothetical protein
VRRLPSAIPLLAAAALIVAGVADAHTQSYPSKITIRQKNEFTYVGRVISDRAACETERRVKVFTADGTYLEETDTDDRGRWRYEFAGNNYYVTVTRRVDGSGNHEHICKPDRSPTTR